MTKVLIKFAQEKPQLVIKGGALGGQALSLKDLEALSKLPAREVLLAQLLGVLQGVPGGLVTVLAGVIRNLLNVLVALKDKKAESEAGGSRSRGGSGGSGGSPAARRSRGGSPAEAAVGAGARQPRLARARAGGAGG